MRHHHLLAKQPQQVAIRLQQWRSLAADEARLDLSHVPRQQRRQRQQRSLIESVEVGDELMTIGGIFGTVQELDDESVTVEVAPNVEIRFVKSAISRKLVYDDDEEDDGAGDEEEAGEPS